MSSRCSTIQMLIVRSYVQFPTMVRLNHGISTTTGMGEHEPTNQLGERHIVRFSRLLKKGETITANREPPQKKLVNPEVMRMYNHVYITYIYIYVHI